MTELTKVVNGEVLPLTESDLADLAEIQAQAPAMQWDFIRSDRNARLAACDWTQLPDAPVDKLLWADYRQVLRDITGQADPFNIVWPKEPPE